ncbi:hypothetical protein C8R43DRAFT_1000772 [Mycena crocata]|nr:hypothetical protein C8R43DRAFT_1000772 [Mycena crocata]
MLHSTTSMWPTDNPHFNPAEILATSARTSEGRVTRSKTRLASSASASGQSASTAENSDSASARVGMPRILAISESFLSPGFENIRRVVVDDTEYPPLKKRRIMKATTPSDATTSAVEEEDPEPKPKKTARNEAERIADLRADFWALEFTAHTVECRGCRRTIMLDRRSTYYSGLFDKHKERCTEVLKGIERQAEFDSGMQ